MKNLNLKILLLVCLSACSNIIKVEKVKVTDNFDNNTAYYKEYFNSSNITKLLGKPTNTKTEGNFKYMEYITKGEPVNEDDSYSYTLKLENDRLMEINKDVYRQVTTKIDTDFIKQLNGQVGVSRENGNYVITNIPFEKKNCENSMIKNTKFQANYMNGVKTGSNIYCLPNRLLDMEHFSYQITGHKYYWQGLSKFFSLDVFAYNKNILNINQYIDDFEKGLKKTQLENTTFTRQTEKIKNYTCQFITKAGEDPKANNKLKEPYLLYKETQGICYDKDILFIVGVSIKYPKSFTGLNNPTDEVKQTINSLKFD